MPALGKLEGGDSVGAEVQVINLPYDLGLELCSYKCLYRGAVPQARPGRVWEGWGYDAVLEPA